MRKVAITAALALASCSGRGEVIPTPSPEPQTPTTAAEELIAAPAPEPEPTTTVAPEPAPSTTLPVLCPSLPHPDHHAPCPELRKQTPTPTNDHTTTFWSIPTYIVMCESGGDWNAYNPSGPSGPYQLMPFHFGGELAMYQSQAAQHAKAAELWNGGRGRSHWAACL